MGKISNPEQLVARWTDLVNDPSLRDLPYKIELNAQGTIEMSPASNWHAAAQAHFAWLLRDRLPHGTVFTECSILTQIGVRVPDAAWGSPEFVRDQCASTPFTRAPEICVEVISPSNSEAEIDAKVRAYLAAGAQEVWLASASDGLSCIGSEGRIACSAHVADAQLPASMPY